MDGGAPAIIDVIPYGPEAVLVQCEPGKGSQLLAAINQRLPRALAHAGESSVLGRLGAGIDVNTVRSATAAQTTDSTRAPKEVVLPIRYNGPDLEFVVATTGLSTESVIERHLQDSYEVAFCGFVAGFSYLHGLDNALRIPRRDTPRTKVPAGSVAIAAEYCAVYPGESPGGWHLIGTCSSELFNPDWAVPVLLPPGTRVQFAREA